MQAPDRTRRPAYDPGCYLCPGNTRANGETNPACSDTFVFTNDFSALVPEAKTVLGDALNDDPLFRVESQRGLCRVMCFSPRHDLTLAEMDTRAIRRVDG